MGKLRIVIADDNERMLQLLEDIIRTDKDMEVVGKAENGEICLSLVRELQPDVVLLDIVMPKLDGLTVMEKTHSDSRIKKKPAFIIITAIGQELSLIHISEPTRRTPISYAVFCLKKKKKQTNKKKTKENRTNL